MEKYLTPQLPPVSIIPEHKKYRRDSASVVDQFFTDSEGLPYSINMNVFLPDITHLRTGLYKSQRPCVTHIKTEPVTIFSHQSETTAPPPAPTQALPEFTSIFSSHQTAAPEVNNIFIKQELPTPDLHLSVPPQQGHLYQLLNTPDLDMPSSTNQTAVMDTLNVSMSAAMAGLNTHTSAVLATAMITADLSIETLQARREWQDILKVMKDNNLQPRILYPARISFKYEGEIKSFTDKQKLREFSTTKPA